VWHAGLYEFICDDAYISFRYAENLAEHSALVWNLGERVEGYTNFLWTVLLGGLDALGLRPEHTSLWLGRLFGGLTVVMIFVIGGLTGGLLPLRVPASAGDPASRWAWLPVYAAAPALAAGCAAFACWSSGGLETQLFTFLSTASFALYLWEEKSSKRVRLSGAIMALAAMTRPEGVLLFGWMGLHRAGFSLVELFSRSGEATTGRATGSARRSLTADLGRLVKRELLWAAGFVLIYGAYFLWRYSYYGYVFPNTYYVKAASPDPGETHRLGWAYLTTFVDYYGLRYLAWVPPVGLALALYEGLRRGGSRIAVFSWTYWLGGTVALGALIVDVGGDFMAMHRFWVPVVPYLALMVQDTLRGLAEIPARKWRDHTPARYGAPLVAGLATLLLVGTLGVRSHRLGERTRNELTVTRRGYHGQTDNMESVAFMKKFARDRVLIGRWLRERVPEDAWMAVGGAGAIVYASGLRAIDTFGLADEHVAHEVEPRSPRPGHQKLAPMSYILSRRPDIICSPHVTRMQDWEYRPRRGERRRWEARGYQYFCATPEGLNPSHYCCLMRVDRDLGLEPVSAYRY
jgi:arabinofuranosyltransferase